MSSAPAVSPFIGPTFTLRPTVYQVIGRTKRDIELVGGRVSAQGEVTFPSSVPHKVAAALAAAFSAAVLDKIDAEKTTGRLL